jgi:Na+-exporting ATPase
VEAILFFAGVELWKWCKRIYFRRESVRNKDTGNVYRGPQDFSRYTTMSRSDTQATGDMKVEGSMV